MRIEGQNCWAESPEAERRNFPQARAQVLETAAVSRAMAGRVGELSFGGDVLVR